MFEYCLFDLDGTLTDPKEGITRCVQYALRHFGIDEPDLNKLEVFIGPPLRDSMKEFYGLNEEQTEKAVALYRERFAPVGVFENRIYEGMSQMLKALHESGKKLAVASSKPDVFVNQILQHFDIKQYFDVIVGSELDGRRENKNEVVEEALLQLRVLDMPEETRKKNCVMVGDRKFDIQGARNYHLTGVGVSYGFAGEGELEEAGADYIADTVEELWKILSQA